MRLWIGLGAALAACAGHRDAPQGEPRAAASATASPTTLASAPSGSAAPSSSAAALSAPASAAPSASTAPSASAAPAAKTDPCDELLVRLGSSEPEAKRKAAIEAGLASCSETFNEAAMTAVIAVAKSLRGDDDAMMTAADRLCIHTRHPATRKRSWDVYAQYLDARFSDGLRARARERYRLHDCVLAPRPGTDSRINR